MGLYSIIFKSNNEFNPLTFEKDLNEILRKINITEKRLISFKRNAKTFRTELVLWLTVIYVAYLVYFVYYQQYSSLQNSYSLYYLAAAVALPVLIYLSNQFLLFYNDKILRYYLKKIKFYKQQHQQKIKDLKTKTNFNKTRSLLQKYSVLDFHAEINENELPGRNSPSKIPFDNNSSLNTSNININDASFDGSDDELLGNNSVNNNSTNHLKNKNNDDEYDDELELRTIEEKYQEREKLRLKRQQIRAGIYVPDSDKKSILTKFFDILVGTDELSPNNRYALVCINCFTHNGLAPPRFLPNKVKYRCFKCGTLNNPDAGNISNISSPTSGSFTEQQQQQNLRLPTPSSNKSFLSPNNVRGGQNKADRSVDTISLIGGDTSISPVGSNQSLESSL